MAQALGWDRVASFYIDLEALVPPSGIPKPGPLQMHLPDDHMRLCDNLVFAGRLVADRVCRLAARPYACPFLMSASDPSAKYRLASLRSAQLGIAD
jgi:hypothetical protein